MIEIAIGEIESAFGLKRAEERFHRLDSQSAVVGRVHAPANDIAAVEVHGDGQIGPALVGFNVGRIRNPSLMDIVAGAAKLLLEQITAIAVFVIAMRALRLVFAAPSALEAALRH